MSQIDCYEVDPVFQCWNWTGKVDKNDGRPLIWRGQRPSAAHRVVYEHHCGPVPEGLVLDHTCANLRCVRPAHIEPVTQTENIRRKRHGYRSRVAKCKNGHDLRVHRMQMQTGGMPCRLCSRGSAP